MYISIAIIWLCKTQSMNIKTQSRLNNEKPCEFASLLCHPHPWCKWKAYWFRWYVCRFQVLYATCCSFVDFYLFSHILTLKSIFPDLIRIFYIYKLLLRIFLQSWKLLFDRNMLFEQIWHRNKKESS